MVVIKKPTAYQKLLEQNKKLQGQMKDTGQTDVAKAEEDMRGAVQKQIGAVDKISDEALKANAMERTLSQGAAQGLAGNQGATGGQAAAVQAEIANKFAPARSTIEQNRQAAYAAAAQSEGDIASKLAAIRSQNLANRISSKVSSTYSSSKQKNPITYSEEPLGDSLSLRLAQELLKLPGAATQSFTPEELQQAWINAIAAGKSTAENVYNQTK